MCTRLRKPAACATRLWYRTERDSNIAKNARQANIDVIERDSWWDEEHPCRVAELSLERYEEQNNVSFDFATVLYGTANILEA